MSYYCVKCRSKREGTQIELVQMKDDKPASRATCEVCGTTMFKMGVYPKMAGDVRVTKTCFISAPITMDQSTLRSVLHDKGIQPFDISYLPPSGLTIIDHLTQAINKADLFLATLDETSSNQNTLIELGIAIALGKRILLLVPPGLDVPFDLSSLLYLRSSLDNHEALSFAIDQLARAPDAMKGSVRPPAGPCKPIGLKANEFLQELDKMGSSYSLQDLEEFVATVLRETGVTVVVPSLPSERRSDFAIWIEEIGPILGNPILVQVKQNIRDTGQVWKLTSQVVDTLHNTNSRFALVLYPEGLPSNVAQRASGVYIILFFQLAELIRKLHSQSLGTVLRLQRNLIVHEGIT